MDRIARMRELLDAALSPQRVEIEDDSHLHAGHAGARGGAGHYRVLIVSEHFEAQSALARHRAVYAALAEMMPAQIHALSIRALTPAQARATLA